MQVVASERIDNIFDDGPNILALEQSNKGECEPRPNCIRTDRNTTTSVFNEADLYYNEHFWDI